MRSLTRDEERQLLDLCQAAGVQISQTVPDDIKVADPAKLRVQLAGTRFDDEGRVHPYYTHGRTGRIISRPSLEVFPWGMLTAPEGYKILDLNEWSIEPLFYAKAAGQTNLCRELTHKGKNIGDVLRDKLGLNKRERQIAKVAFFWHVCGTAKNHEGTEVHTMIDRIIGAYPKLAQTTSDRRLSQMRTVNMNISTFWLNIAKSARNHPHCRLVGFWHMEPLVECIESEVTATTAELVGMGEAALTDMAA